MYLLGIIFLVALGISGCTSVQKTADDESGVQLWAQNCQRCHESPPPNAYSDDQWDVAINHMRVRAHISGLQAQKVVSFLKSAN